MSELWVNNVRTILADAKANPGQVGTLGKLHAAAAIISVNLGVPPPLDLQQAIALEAAGVWDGNIPPQIAKESQIT